MKVRLTKKHTFHAREIAKGAIADVSRAMAAELIEKGIAEDLDAPKKEVKKVAPKAEKEE